MQVGDKQAPTTTSFTDTPLTTTIPLQHDVYDATTRPIVTDVLAGFNGTVICYGQVKPSPSSSHRNCIDTHHAS